MGGRLRWFSKTGMILGLVADALGVLMYLAILVFYVYILLFGKYLVNRLLLTISLYKYKVPRDIRGDILRVFDEKWFKNLGFGSIIYKLVRD
ncbi:hypothetical protein [Thermosphaera aggregans]|jgi:hypothetical protein|uniref:RDD family protein n=1 Tax=Thermosphaera aggregans (strain DSM 11486 / M11TL) TaxID=633148 RepID=D5U0A5_THEAM|nr:hypothetical protein [Thermosphaera aggregans]ADG90555.1 hypothetical protein Tagg_0278 [Thermosphaera aggregans DSM 11486]